MLQKRPGTLPSTVRTCAHVLPTWYRTPTFPGTFFKQIPIGSSRARTEHGGCSTHEEVDRHYPNSLPGRRTCGMQRQRLRCGTKSDVRPERKLRWAAERESARDGLPDAEFEESAAGISEYLRGDQRQLTAEQPVRLFPLAVERRQHLHRTVHSDQRVAGPVAARETELRES